MVFLCFQGVSKDISGFKWVNDFHLSHFTKKMQVAMFKVFENNICIITNRINGAIIYKVTDLSFFKYTEYITCEIMKK